MELCAHFHLLIHTATRKKIQLLHHGNEKNADNAIVLYTISKYRHIYSAISNKGAQYAN